VRGLRGGCVPLDLCGGEAKEALSLGCVEVNTTPAELQGIGCSNIRKATRQREVRPTLPCGLHGMAWKLIAKATSWTYRSDNYFF